MSVNEGNAGTTNAVFNVSLSAASLGTVVVNYSTAPGTATGGSDFAPALGTLTFAPGETSKTVNVRVMGDTAPEPNETFFLNLTLAGGTATLKKDKGVGTIVDGEAPNGVFRLAASSLNASEGDGHVAVTVNRVGSTSGDASVEYATTDGTASERSDYETTLGRLHFAPGESSKTFTVLLVDDAHVEGGETVSLVLGNPSSGASVGTPGAALLTVADNDAAATPTNPIDRTDFFVRQHYLDFLSREPDPEGLRFWVQGIDSCGADAQCREVKRIDTSAAFLLSIEFQETGFLAYRMDKAALDRLPRYREFVRDSQEIGRGVVVGQPGFEAQLETNKQAFAAEFVTRAEFTALYDGLTNAQYVDALNANTGGSLSAAERDRLVGGLDGGAETRATVLRKAADNADFRARQTAPAFVPMEYFGYLRRDPDDTPDADFSGYDFWLSKLEEFGGDFRRAEMVKAFLSSNEYRRRFGQP